MRKRWWLILVIAAAVLVAAWTPARSAMRYLSSPEIPVQIQLTGLGCGSHLSWTSDNLAVQPGQRVRLANNSQYWSTAIRITAADSPKAPSIAESQILAPGESWTYTFWKPGRYFITTVDENLYWAGVRGWITVGEEPVL